MTRRHPIWRPNGLRDILMSLPLLLLNVAIGALLLVAVAGAGATRRRARPKSDGRCLLGWALVAVPLPLAVAMHLLLQLPLMVDEAIFVAGVLAFAAGAFLVLGRDDADWNRWRGDDSEPPWWPDFERRLHVYSTRRSPRPDRMVVS
jgi:hypothetical protein